MKTEISSYEQQAADFLATFKIGFDYKRGDKTAPWGPESGNHYIIYFDKVEAGEPDKRLQFDFWGSVNDKAAGRSPSAYDVLACIAGDAHCPDSFADFCAEYGYDEDSRKAEATYKRANAFCRQLWEFFTSDEIEALAEIA